MLLVPSNADLSAAVMDRKHKEFGEVPEAHEAPEGRVLPEVQMVRHDAAFVSADTYLIWQAHQAQCGKIRCWTSSRPISNRLRKRRYGTHIDAAHRMPSPNPNAHEFAREDEYDVHQRAMEYEKEKVATWRESPAMSKSDHTTAPASDTSTQTSPTLARTLVLHAAPTKFKPGQIRRWIEEDNKATAVQILGIRWLTQEHRGASHGKKNLAHHRIRLVQMRLWRNSHSSIIVF
ncbi:hypothetical protein BGX38DRAFT_1311257 [Terfezia claveryi]|nr:hypothetical protein BGX38DRAFT_1311257 [Terfezia claveryi]